MNPKGVGKAVRAVQAVRQARRRVHRTESQAATLTPTVLSSGNSHGPHTTSRGTPGQNSAHADIGAPTPPRHRAQASTRDGQQQRPTTAAPQHQTVAGYPAEQTSTPYRPTGRTRPVPPRLLFGESRSAWSSKRTYRSHGPLGPRLPLPSSCGDRQELLQGTKRTEQDRRAWRAGTKKPGGLPEDDDARLTLRWTARLRALLHDRGPSQRHEGPLRQTVKAARV